MLAWLSDNLINIALILALALVVTLLIRSLVRSRRAGKSPCGGQCAHCAMVGSCHSR